MGYTLLLVEDEDLTRQGILRQIAWDQLGIEYTLLAEDGRLGLEMAQKTNVDIVLTDVKMPHLDGVKMAFAIRRINPYCKFIFLSGFCDKEYLKAAIELTAVNYLEKPLNLTEVTEAIQHAVQQLEKEALERKLVVKYQQETQKAEPDPPDCTASNLQPQALLAHRIRHYVQENCLNKCMSLSLLADQFRLTKSYLCWVYKKEYDTTINQWMIECRIRWAKNYIAANEQARIKEVANKAGFTNSNYFIKIFKKNVGQTPAEYKHKQWE